MIVFLMRRITIRRWAKDWLRVLLLGFGVALASSTLLAVLYASKASIDSLDRSTDIQDVPQEKTVLGTRDEFQQMPFLKPLKDFLILSLHEVVDLIVHRGTRVHPGKENARASFLSQKDYSRHGSLP